MNYDNQTCPACGRQMAGDEDVVVCPVCATPQHRECWKENGRCANESLHESGYVWKRENVTAQAEDENSAPEQNDIRICHICGSENPEDALHCGNCGALFSSDSKKTDDKKCPHCGKMNDDDALHCNQCGAPLGADAASTAFFGGTPYIAGTNIPADEKIGENTAGDLAVYIRSSAGRYIKKFKRFESGKKLSFNFAALFFAPGWFFYRKLYKAGIFFLIAFTTLSIFTSNQYTVIEDASKKYAEPVEKAYSEYYEATLDENITEEELEAKLKNAADPLISYFRETAKPYIILYGSMLALSLLCALIADRMYYKKLLDDMQKISEEHPDPPEKRFMLIQKGGTSVLAFIICSLSENMLVNMLFSVAQMIKELL